MHHCNMSVQRVNGKHLLASSEPENTLLPEQPSSGVTAASAMPTMCACALCSTGALTVRMCQKLAILCCIHYCLRWYHLLVERERAPAAASMAKTNLWHVTVVTCYKLKQSNAGHSAQRLDGSTTMLKRRSCFCIV